MGKNVQIKIFHYYISKKLRRLLSRQIMPKEKNVLINETTKIQRFILRPYIVSKKKTRNGLMIN